MFIGCQGMTVPGALGDRSETSSAILSSHLSAYF